MAAFIIRRVFWAIVIVFVAMTLTFTLTYVIPADPAAQVAGPRATETEINNIRESLGLNDPILVQYGRYFGNVLQGDFGRSWMFRRPVSQAVFGRLPASIQLGLAAALVEIIVGGAIGITGAIYRYRWPDRVSMILTLVALSLPSFWFGLVLLFVLGFLVPIFPLGGYGELKHLVLPALAIGIPFSAWYARVLRSSIREVMSEQFVRAVRAKGLTERVVFMRHVLPNALIPIVTMWGMDLGRFIGGVALVEVVFGWPGIGWQAVEAARNLDVPLVMGSVLLVSALMAFANLAVDVSYRWLDPRVVLD
jgi:peptide/nickel transport system permease protein